MSGAIPPLTQYASMEWCSVKSNVTEFSYLHLYILVRGTKISGKNLWHLLSPKYFIEVSINCQTIII
jgi:hypothetical protein